MKKKIITLIIGTLAIFIWNAVSWTVLPLHSNSLNNIPDSVIDQQTFKSQLPESGIYHYPGLPEDYSEESIERIEKKLAEGPRITFMAYTNGSTKLFEMKAYAFNLAFNFISVLLLLFIVSKQHLKSLPNVLVTTISIGLLISFMSDLPQMNWFMFPLNYTLPNILDHLVSFTLLGLIFGSYTFKTKS